MDPIEELSDEARRARGRRLLERLLSLLSANEVERELAYIRAGQRPVSADPVQLACYDCGEDFVLSASTRAWFTDRGMALPKRCEACRRARRTERRVPVPEA